MKTNLLKIDISENISPDQVRDEFNLIVDYLTKKKTAEKWNHALCSTEKHIKQILTDHPPKMSLTMNIDFEDTTPADQAKNELQAMMKFLEVNLTNNDHFKEWDHALYIEIDPAIMKCTKCASCGQWINDEKADEPAKKLRKGHLFNDKIYCDACMDEIKKKL